MSTLGPRNKRITRKALANVEIPRTCEIIAQPPEPLALRLSGHLLVGVARYVTLRRVTQIDEQRVQPKL